MNSKEESSDRLRALFGRMPEEALPVGFNERMMSRVREEAVRRERRAGRLEALGLALSSLSVAGVLAGALIYAGVPTIRWEAPELAALPFYLHIGSLALVLLGMDYLVRRAYRKRHS
ncbi:MAG: hypothetical protein LBJ58_07190 [Tannerellaceae bacterium]|jgi:hypothetical protein|nr:hypothetical protein [Tannerellaceae bacterium]